MATAELQKFSSEELTIVGALASLHGLTPMRMCTALSILMVCGGEGWAGGEQGLGGEGGETVT